MEMADRCYIFCRYAGLHHNFGDLAVTPMTCRSEDQKLLQIFPLSVSQFVFLPKVLCFLQHLCSGWCSFSSLVKKKNYKILFIEKQKKVFWNMGERFRFTAGAVSATSSVFQGSELCMPLVPEPAEGSLYRPIYILSYFHLLHTCIVWLKLMSGSQI